MEITNQKTTIIGIVLAGILLCGVVSADLPSSVQATITSIYSIPGSQYYWSVYVNHGSGDIPTGSTWGGWCVDSQKGIGAGTYTFPVYSSLNINAGSPAYLQTINWNKVNYVINHKSVAHNNMQAIQAAIWHYDGGIPTSTHAYDSWFTSADYLAMVAAADANPTYSPGPGEKYAVILYIVGYQALMIEVPIPDVPVPEFPILAVPAIFMISAIYMIAHIKSRKEE